VALVPLASLFSTCRTKSQIWGTSLMQIHECHMKDKHCWSSVVLNEQLRLQVGTNCSHKLTFASCDWVQVNAAKSSLCSWLFLLSNYLLDFVGYLSKEV
jgi:hypothetical protein